MAGLKSRSPAEILTLRWEWEIHALWDQIREAAERGRGLPQGSPVSPLLANLYLDTFDEELLDQGFRLVRFADDFVVLAKDDVP